MQGISLDFGICNLFIQNKLGLVFFIRSYYHYQQDDFLYPFQGDSNYLTYFVRDKTSENSLSTKVSDYSDIVNFKLTQINEGKLKSMLGVARLALLEMGTNCQAPPELFSPFQVLVYFIQIPMLNEIATLINFLIPTHLHFQESPKMRKKKKNPPETL